MADKLTEIFNDWNTGQPHQTLFEAFQGGFTAAAISMRERAMACVDIDIDTSDEEFPCESRISAIKNAIGQLSDIP